MKCSCKGESIKSDVSQEFPENGLIGKHLNLNLADLNEKFKKLKLNDDSILYLYPLSTVKFGKNIKNEKTFIQTGCAPNYQGDLITLCTCMHRMRTKIDNSKGWENIWICGIKKPNYIFYLMRVEKAYDSMLKLWNNLNPKIRREKSASINYFGDIYKPKEKISFDNYDDEVNPDNYIRPKNHVHKNSWEKDIEQYDNKKTFYLVGDNKLSFLWSKPVIKFSYQIYPGWKGIAVGEFKLKLIKFIEVLK